MHQGGGNDRCVLSLMPAIGVNAENQTDRNLSSVVYDLTLTGTAGAQTPNPDSLLVFRPNGGYFGFTGTCWPDYFHESLTSFRLLSTTFVLIPYRQQPCGMALQIPCHLAREQRQAWRSATSPVT